MRSTWLWHAAVQIWPLTGHLDRIWQDEVMLVLPGLYHRKNWWLEPEKDSISNAPSISSQRSPWLEVQLVNHRKLTLFSHDWRWTRIHRKSELVKYVCAFMLTFRYIFVHLSSSIHHMNGPNIVGSKRIREMLPVFSLLLDDHQAWWSNEDFRWFEEIQKIFLT